MHVVEMALDGGAILLFAGTWLHPMRADPNVPLAAFTEYAAAILIERQDTAVAETLRIVGIVTVADERLGILIEQIQSVGCRNPHALRIVFQHRPNVVMAQ